MESGAHGSRAATDSATVVGHRANRFARDAGRKVVLAAALLLAAAALACALPGLARAADLGSTSFADALTTTGPTPPPGVLPASGARGALAAAGEVLLTGAPAYIWHDGCAPTSAGMLLGFYDGHGFPGLIAGDASTQTTAVDQAIASHGSAAAPEHYEDYALPKEIGSSILRDRSEDAQAGVHADDSIADFMLTSRSSLGLAYGWSFTSYLGSSVQDYVAQVDPSVAVAYHDLSPDGYGLDRLTFDVYKAQIDAGRPVVLYVDSSGDGALDHAVLGIGYRETGGSPEYACWDTWSTSVRWSRFEDDASMRQFEVFGATTFSFTSSDPSVDASAPVTTVKGAGDGWNAGPVTLTFGASDVGSGVDHIDAAIDAASLDSLGGMPATLEVSGQGVHTVWYRAVDKQGNEEDTHSCRVRIDAEAPVTGARAAVARQGARVSLHFRVGDLTPKAFVRLVVRTPSGRARVTLRPGWRATGALQAASWRATLARGVYRLWVYATDQAGNRQVTAGSARLVIR